MPAPKWIGTRVALLRRAAQIMKSDADGARILGEWLGEDIGVNDFKGARARHGIPAAHEREAAALAARFDAATETDESRMLPPFLGDPHREVDTDIEDTIRPEDTIPPADRTYVDRPVASRSLPPLDLGGELERIFLVPDAHFPFHNKRAWSVMLKAAKAFRPHTLVCLGDFVDCFAISFHDRDPRRGTQLSNEIAVANEGLDELDALGAARKVFTLGNHEHRLPTYLMRNAPALVGLVPEMPGQLRLAERGWMHCGYREVLRIGKLGVSHELGHAGVHAMHNTAKGAAHSIAFGHTHALGITYYGSLFGDRYMAATLGHLSDISTANWAAPPVRARWQEGFGQALMEPNGNFHLKPVPIIDGRCVMDVNAAVIE